MSIWMKLLKRLKFFNDTATTEIYTYGVLQVVKTLYLATL